MPVVRPKKAASRKVARPSRAKRLTRPTPVAPVEFAAPEAPNHAPLVQRTQRLRLKRDLRKGLRVQPGLTPAAAVDISDLISLALRAITTAAESSDDAALLLFDRVEILRSGFITDVDRERGRHNLERNKQVAAMVAELVANRPWDRPDANGARTEGHPTKFTERTITKLLISILDGSPASIAAREAGLNAATLGVWKAKYPAFHEAVEVAKAESIASLVRTVKRSAHGHTCRSCTLGALPGGTKCEVCNGSGFAIKPDGRLGLQLLSRRDPKNFADQSKVKHEITGNIGVDATVQVSGSVVVSHVALEGVEGDRLIALAWAGEGDAPQLEDRDAIEAVEAEAG